MVSHIRVSSEKRHSDHPFVEPSEELGIIFVQGGP